MALAISNHCNAGTHSLQCVQVQGHPALTNHKESLATPLPAWHRGIRTSNVLTETSSFGGRGLKHVRLTAASTPWPKTGRRVPLQVKAQEAGTSTVVAQDVDFVWKGAGSEVLLTGDFFNWDGKVPLTRNGDGFFQVKQKVSPGQHTFKFIVDGVWQHSPDYPVVEDGAGGFNNLLQVTDAPPPPAPKAAAPAPKAAEEAKPEPKAAGEPAGKKVVGKGKLAGKKVAAKPIGAAMEEDIIPQLKTALEKEDGLMDLTLTFEDNQLRGSFLKGVPYAFWCYFPDGILEGPRGFSLATHGGEPSTVEPFLIDERKVTPELFVFWVQKRLFAQKLLSLN